MYLSIHPSIHLSKLSCLEVRSFQIDMCPGAVDVFLGHGTNVRCVGSELEDPSEIKPRYGDTEMMRWCNLLWTYLLNLVNTLILFTILWLLTWDLPEIDIQSNLPWGVWYQDARPEVWWLCCFGLEGYPVLVCVLLRCETTVWYTKDLR